MQPTQKEINAILSTAKIASKKAGNYLLKNFRQHDPSKYSYKKHREIVTQADKKANEIIIKTIKEKFPEHNIVSEEASYPKNKSAFIWYIDPLDGTTNYTAGLPLFSVNIGITYNDEPIVGVINLPHDKELYHAVEGKGAWCADRKLRVSKTSKLKESFLQLCHAYSAKERLGGAQVVKKITGKCRVYRRFGCAGIEHTNVASGRTDAIIIIGSRPWDNMAGALIIREAGGSVTDRKNKEWNAKSKDVIATNGKIHKQLLHII